MKRMFHVKHPQEYAMEDQTTHTGQAAPTKTWDAALYDGKHSFVWKYGASLIELLAPQPGERILDLGCGTGHLTAQIAAAGAEVVGIDKSPGMIEEARKNYPHLRFELADGADFTFNEPFDAVFSNAALHWMMEPERVVACISRALRPGGRFVAEFGGKGCVRAFIEAVYTAMEAAGYPTKRETPFWFFPSIGEYAPLLERQSLAVTSALLFDRPTPLEDGEAGLRLWLKMFGNLFFLGMSAEQQSEVIRQVEMQLRPTCYRDGTWIAPYVRLRIVALKEPAA
jgi:trans-aconitate methyltransferase